MTFPHKILFTCIVSAGTLARKKKGKKSFALFCCCMKKNTAGRKSCRTSYFNRSSLSLMISGAMRALVGSNHPAYHYPKLF